MLFGALHSVLRGLQLSLQARHDLDVAPELRGQGAEMRRLERPYFRFLFCEFRSRVGNSTVKERGCTLGQLLLRFKIFVDKQRGQFAVYLLREFRRTCGVPNLEGRKLRRTSGSTN